jgi:hypothetical protein
MGKAPHKLQTKLREDEYQKKKLQEENDVLLAIGEDGQKGVDAFKEHVKEEEKIKQVTRDIQQETLNKKNRKADYNNFLASILNEKLVAIEWPSGWEYNIGTTDIGVVMELRNGKKTYRTAFQSSGEGVYDLNAVEVFALRAENTIDKHTEVKKTDSGIILPS